MKFEWDEEKNETNIEKHKVSFEEAKTVFDDTNAVYIYDEANSTDEDRFNVIGIAEGFERKLTVCHCYRGENDEIIRIISARRANKHESKLYEEGLLHGNSTARDR